MSGEKVTRSICCLVLVEAKTIVSVLVEVNMGSGAVAVMKEGLYTFSVFLYWEIK